MLDNRTRDIKDEDLEVEDEEEKELIDHVEKTTEHPGFDDEEEPEKEEEEQEDKPTSEPEQKPVTPPVVDYEERYKSSTRESQILDAKNKQFTQTVEAAFAIDKLEEEELRMLAKSKGVEWDDLSAFEKDIFKDNALNSKRLQIIGASVQAGKDVDSWVNKVKGFTDENETSQKYPSLAGREDEFVRFCLKENARGVDLDILASSFSANLPKPQPKKGSALLPNRSGAGTSTGNKYTEEDMIAIRNRSQKEYKNLLQKGKFNHILNSDD